MPLSKTKNLSTQEKQSHKKAAVALLGATYVAGFVGLILPETNSLFRLLTPFNLILSTFILLYFHQGWNKSFFIFIGIAVLTGFFVEVIGVSTGLIFGNYSYGSTLGFKAFNVPLIIGVNWLLLIYATGVICSSLKMNLFAKAALASALMVILDFFIEPVAMALDFWHWNNNNIPLQNYLGWFSTAFSLHIVFFSLSFSKENPIAKYLYMFQLIFFILLCLFII